MSRALWWLALCGVTALALTCSRPTERPQRTEQTHRFKGHWLAAGTIERGRVEVADFGDDSVRWSGIVRPVMSYVERGDTAIVIDSSGFTATFVFHGDSIMTRDGISEVMPVMHRVR